jgi:hypothetical protein
MSQPNDPKPVELHMFSPSASTDIVELLVVTAHFHRTGERLALGHTVNFGRPWLEESQSEYGLISLPYLDGPALENIEIGEQTVKAYWLIPITAAEVAFKKAHGLDVLEEVFETKNFDYADPNRASVV